jgi:hypothetical protein
MKEVDSLQLWMLRRILTELEKPLENTKMSERESTVIQT